MNKKKVLSGFAWKYMERCAAQVITFLVTLVLARLLSPETYGTIALINVFITILDVFIQSGMGTALIQKKDADDLDFSTLFYFNIFSCSLLYLGLFFVAPFIANFYENKALTAVVRVVGLTLVVSGVKGIQQSYVSKHMQFRKFFWATIIGTIISAFVGILMAYKGFGIWALVAQSLTNNIIDTILLWVTVKWRPKLMFSFARLKQLFSFGWKMLCSALIDRVYNNLRSMIIGKMYSNAELAFYNKGQSLPQLIISNVNSSIDSVLLPAMAQEQDRPERVKAITKRSIKTSVYLIAPLMMGLFACAEPIVRILLTEKWLPSVFFMRIICVTYIFYPIHTSNLNAIKAMGRSDLFLILEIIKKVVGLIALAATMFISVEAMSWSLLLTSVLGQIINSWPNKKLMNYSYLEQLKDILPGILLAVFMGVCVYCVNFIGLNSWLILLIQVALGAIIYLGLSALLKLESFTYCFNMVKPMLNKILRKKEAKNED